MDGKSSDTIDGELSCSRINPIFSPFVPTLDDLYEPIFKPILDPDDLSDAPSPKSHNDPRNSLNTQSIGIMKTIGTTEKSNIDNGRNAWNI